MASKKVSKKVSKKPEVIEIVASKSTGKNGATLSYVTSDNIEQVSPETIFNAGTVMRILCYNILIGNVHPDIEKAARDKGGLARLFNGKISEGDANAIRTLGKAGYLVNDTAKSKDIRTKWEAYVEQAKRVPCISLQRLMKIVTGSDSDPKPTLKGEISAWITKYPKKYALLDKDLATIFIEFNCDTASK
jgi:hypothetical protein